MWQSSRFPKLRASYCCKFEIHRQYLVHFLLSTVDQKLLMPDINCSFVCGFISRRMNSLSSCHMFSIGLRSGDSAAVFHHSTLLSLRNFCARPEVCFGSLSCINRWLTGNLSLIKGNKPVLIISTYNSEFMIPSKITMFVGPFKLMPAQTWTLIGCLGLQDTPSINAIFHHLF